MIKAMTDAINAGKSPLEAVGCLLMVKLIARMDADSRCVFWETLPDRFPDLTAHVPALIAAVRDETHASVLDRLSSHPLPTTLSPETVSWRAGLVAAWEKQLKAARDDMDKGIDRSQERYMFSLKGLAQVDGCGMPPGTTCLSVLPTLLNEIRCLQKKEITPAPVSNERDDWRNWYKQKFGILAMLAGWRPAQNVTTDPAVLNEWVDFWLELYQKAGVDALYSNCRYAPIILKGIAAKALLNLTETNGKEATARLTGMEPLLLKSLIDAADVAEEEIFYFSIPYPLNWLSWQPQDVTRFPIDSLAELPKQLLNRFRLSLLWRDAGKTIKPVAQPLLTELIRWDRAGLLAACGVDLLSSVVTCLIDCLCKFPRDCARWNESLLSHEVCRWLVRDDVANIEDGRELLRKLKNYWQTECNSPPQSDNSRCIAWNGRMQLQRAGLAAKKPDTFYNDLLEWITDEIREQVRLVLSIWKPEKDEPKKWRTAWEDLRRTMLNPSYGFGYLYREFLITSALALLKPDPADNIVIQRQKLWDVLCALPEENRPKLSVADITYLMGGLLVGDPNADPNTAPGRMWQFKPDEMRFRVPTAHVASASTASIPIQAFMSEYLPKCLRET